MKNPITQTIIVGIAALFIIAIGSWIFLLSPRMEEPATLDAAAYAATAQGEELILQAASLQRYAQDATAAERAATELGERFPEQPNIPYLIEQVQTAAARAQIPSTRVTIVPSAPESNDPPAPVAVAGETEEELAARTATAALQTARMNVSITTYGTLTEVTSFITELQSTTRIIVVDSIRLSKRRSTEGTITLADGTVTEAATGVPEYDLTVNAHVIMLPRLDHYTGNGSNVYSPDLSGSGFTDALGLTDGTQLGVDTTDTSLLDIETTTSPENDPFLNPSDNNAEAGGTPSTASPSPTNIGIGTTTGTGTGTGTSTGTATGGTNNNVAVIDATDQSNPNTTTTTRK